MPIVSMSASVSPGKSLPLSPSKTMIAPFGILGKKCSKAAFEGEYKFMSRYKRDIRVSGYFSMYSGTVFVHLP